MKSSEKWGLREVLHRVWVKDVVLGASAKTRPENRLKIGWRNYYRSAAAKKAKKEILARQIKYKSQGVVLNPHSGQNYKKLLCAFLF